MHRLLRRDRQRQRLRVGQPDVLYGHAHDTPGNIERILAAVEHTAEPLLELSETPPRRRDDGKERHTAEPLLKRGLVETEGIIVDSKTGVSGGGRSPSPAFHLPEASEGIRPYKVGSTHRHTPEIEQELSLAAGAAIEVVFTPVLAPMSRGILATTYARLKPGVSEDDCRKAARELYSNGLVTVLDVRPR